MLFCIPMCIGCGKLSNQLGVRTKEKKSASAAAKNVPLTKSLKKVHLKSKNTTVQTINITPISLLMTSVTLLMTAGLVWKVYIDCKQDLAQNITRTYEEYTKEVAKWKNLYERESQKVVTMSNELAECKQQRASASNRYKEKEEALYMCLEREAQRTRKEEKETELANREVPLNEIFSVKNRSHMLLKREGLYLEQEKQLRKVMMRHQTAERKVKAKQERYRQYPRK